MKFGGDHPNHLSTPIPSWTPMLFRVFFVIQNSVVALIIRCSPSSLFPPGKSVTDRPTDRPMDGRAHPLIVLCKLKTVQTASSDYRDQFSSYMTYDYQGMGKRNVSSIHSILAKSCLRSRPQQPHRYSGWSWVSDCICINIV